LAKARTEFLCRECGYRNPRSLGRCPECDAWGSFDEVREAAPVTPARRAAIGFLPQAGLAAKPVRLGDIAAAHFDRLLVGIDEFARVLGGGIVKGSLTLIGGDPGVGKST
jgi:DNA repair protein RadA/Sms